MWHQQILYPGEGAGGGGGGDATWSQLYQDVCVQKGRTGVVCRPQGSGMSENVSLKIGVKFAVSHNMG